MFDRKITMIIMIVFISLLVFIPSKSFAMEKDFSSYAQIMSNKTNNTYMNNFDNMYNQDGEYKDCDSILGDPVNDPNSVAWLLFKILNYIRILGPLAVVVLSGIEYTLAIVNSDDDTMKKAHSHLKTRLIMVALLFLLPTIIKILFQVFGIATDCGVLNGIIINSLFNSL